MHSTSHSVAVPDSVAATTTTALNNLITLSRHKGSTKSSLGDHSRPPRYESDTVRQQGSCRVTLNQTTATATMCSSTTCSQHLSCCRLLTTQASTRFHCMAAHCGCRQQTPHRNRAHCPWCATGSATDSTDLNTSETPSKTQPGHPAVEVPTWQY